MEGAAIANIDNPNWILDLRVSSCGFCCHLTGEDAAEIPQTFDCAAAELYALMLPGYHPDQKWPSRQDRFGQGLACGSL